MKPTREVYLGNGQTTTVQPTNQFKQYDFDKLALLLAEGKQFDVGMAEDWYWTSEPMSSAILESNSVAGIDSSDWATPSISYDNGETFVDCYILKD